MLTIRRIYDYFSPANRLSLAYCKELLALQNELTTKEVDEILIAAQNQFQSSFRHLILVAEIKDNRAIGVLIASHYPKENFFFVDYLASDPKRSGINGALYERLREEATAADVVGIFIDRPTEDFGKDETVRKRNISWLRFFERYGVRPMAKTEYALPRKDNSVSHLLLETPSKQPKLPAKTGKKIIKAILETKYGAVCSPEYVKSVVNSVKGDYVLQRPPQFIKKEVYIEIKKTLPSDKKIGLVVNEGHIIHHIRDKGYVESPVRVKSILKELDKVKIFERSPAKNYPDSWIEAVHYPEFLTFLKKACASAVDNEVLYPEIFPKRFPDRIPLKPEHQIGYYCIDSTTPIHANAFKAARAAANCALTAADQVIGGRQMSYALVRPPGHHAERKYFGGFCYLNSNAIAANYLSKKGKVVILDIDYHHGNGQQNIFYKRSDVYTISIHGDPVYVYPNFTGFADERGAEEGMGYNLNIPMKNGTDGKGYRKGLHEAIEQIKKYDPTYLVIALGLDTAAGDPTGTWLLSPQDFTENGRILAKLNLPTLIVQEGGYNTRDLGINARHFFEGMWEGFYR